MTIYRFISKKPEGSESEGYNATVVEARDRGAAQKAMTNRLAMGEAVVSVSSLESGQWLALEGRIAVPSDQLSLHPNSDTELTWEGDVINWESANDHVRQPPKVDGKQPGQSRPSTSAQFSGANGDDQKPPVVVVMYVVTAILLLGGLFGLFAVPFNRMDAISSVTMLLALFSPALVSWIVTVSLSYLSGIHSTLKRIEVLQSNRG